MNNILTIAAKKNLYFLLDSYYLIITMSNTYNKAMQGILNPLIGWNLANRISRLLWKEWNLFMLYLKVKDMLIILPCIIGP